MAQILFFGALSEHTKHIAPSLELPDEVTNGAELITWLGAMDTALGERLGRKGIRLAVNKALCSLETKISNNDEIAFMSALSGG